MKSFIFRLLRGPNMCFATMPFEISLPGECEQLLSSCLDVIAEQHTLAIFGQDGTEADQTDDLAVEND